MGRSNNKTCAALIVCLLVGPCASVSAETVHHCSRGEERLRSHWLDVPPAEHGRGGARFAVPGWTNAQTLHWMENASTSAG
jgi:hypothetical protein